MEMIEKAKGITGHVGEKIRDFHGVPRREIGQETGDTGGGRVVKYPILQALLVIEQGSLWPYCYS